MSYKSQASIETCLDAARTKSRGTNADDLYFCGEGVKRVL